MYKKHGRHNIDAESANNEEQFATQFFNFMRKVTTIREGREFEDFDYPDKEEGIEKLKDA
jgi:hypothetical protein